MMSLNKKNIPAHISAFYRKILFALLAVAISAQAVSAQSTGVPQQFNYATQVTDSTGLPIANTTVNMLVTLTSGSPTGPVVYSETNLGTTTPGGIFVVVVGGGIAISGNITTVPWTSAPVYLSTAMDVTGGTNFVNLGSAQLISQPYSIVSGNGVSTITFDSTGKLNVTKANKSEVISSSQSLWMVGGNSGAGSNGYIGTNDSADFVLKSNGQEGLRVGNGKTLIAGNLGIAGVSSPLTAAQINGALALQDTVVNISGNVTLNAGNRSSFLINTSVPPSSAACSLSNGQVAGQLLMIMVSGVNSSNNGISFASGSNFRLATGNGNHTKVSLNDAGVITFIWNGTQWLESSISNNN
jgi:hypothetical protein